MDRTSILKRPKPTDGEEELFSMQEEFLKNKQQSSAKVINLRGSAKSVSSTTPTKASESQTSSGKVKSRFSELKKLKIQDRISTSQSGGDVVNPVTTEETQKKLETRLQDSVQNMPKAPSNIILGNIVEKKYDSRNYEFNKSSVSGGSESGFPEVFISENMKNDDNQSLFLQQVKSKKDKTNNAENLQNIEPMYESEGSVMVEGSFATEIHKENVERLNQMSQEDIMREISKLETLIKPELLEFVKNRRHKHQKLKIGHKKIEALTSHNQNQRKISERQERLVTTEIANTSEEGSSKNNNVTSMEIDEPKCIAPKPPVDLMEQAKEKGWVHMDTLELEKLKWMEDIPEEETDGPAPVEPYNARFDFNGSLLPYKDRNISFRRGLHHHGHEPHRPGYSLGELLELSQSSSQQQRCAGLITLANVIEKSRRGWYDKALQPAPLNVLNQYNLLILRSSLDHNSVAVVTATLRALRAFLYSEADEVCLDRLYGLENYKEPALITPKTDDINASKLKDQVLIQLDAVAGLLRTNIIIRIRYILESIRPPPVGVTCALEILIRLTRHSTTIALNIANTPDLLPIIIKHFMPLSTNSLATQNIIENVYGVPVIAAVRFCRILLCYGGKPVAQILDRLNILQCIMSYVTCDAGERSFNLSIESLRLWKALLVHGEVRDSLSDAQLVLVPQLQLLLSNHDLQNASELSCEYAATLISVACSLPPLRANISVLLSKWSTQLLSLTNITWGKTKLIAETLLGVRHDVNVGQTLTISRSQVFSKLQSTSNLLSNHTLVTDREPSSLPHLGVLTRGGQLQPIVSQQSCIPFLVPVMNTYIWHYAKEEILAVLSHPQLCEYLKKLEMTDWCLERSWYTKREQSFLFAVVIAASMVKDKLDNRTVHIIWKIAIKLISSLPADSPHSVKDMIRIGLSEEKLNFAIMANKLETLNLDSNIEDIKVHLNRNVATLYQQYVPSNGEWNQAAMPKDWIYLPVVHIYTKYRDGNTCNDVDKTAILTVLNLELVLPDLVENLLQSLRFSRLVLVYLCDTLYLNNDVSALLTRTVSTLLKDHHKKLNFTVDVPGLTSFTDLFTVMCEHFGSTSYGDFGFSMVLLVPIAQRHDVHYRKLLWSEHAGLLRYIRLPVEQLVIPLKEYLYPLEENASLIESYITALVRGIVKESLCPIPYAIAVHHSAMYLKQPIKLAVRMKARLEKIPDKDLAALLLSYKPPKM